MDWITGMQKAIDYIEANLTEEIDYEKVAAESFSSSYARAFFPWQDGKRFEVSRWNGRTGNRSYG